MAYSGPQPHKPESLWFGLFPVRSPLLGESLFIFSSSGYLDVSVHRVPSRTLFIHVRVTGHNSSRVAPFGNPWFDASLRLSMAYRSLPRPSSAPDAKAFTLRSLSLDCLYRS